MLFVVKGEALFADLRQPLFQIVRRQGVRRVGVHAFLVQQFGYLIVRQGGEERLAGAGGVHRQFAADRRRHAHQRRTLHLIDDDRLVLAGIQHRQVDGFAGLFHQAAQRRVHHRQQVAALQEAAADHKGVRADGPQAEIADLAHESLLLHGGEQAVSGGVRQAGLLGQIGQRHVALGFRNVLQQLQATGQRLYLAGRRTGGRGCCAGLLAAFGGSRGGHG